MKSVEKRRSLAIASIVLGAISSVCCMSTGFGIVPALIGTAFGVIAIISGSEKARRIGVVGLVLGIIGIVTNTIVIVWAVNSIDWSTFTIDDLLSYLHIDSKELNDMMKEMEQYLQGDV